MKKILFVLFAWLFFTGSVQAVINTPVVTALNSSTYTAITVTTTNGPYTAGSKNDTINKFCSSCRQNKMVSK